MRDIDIDMPAAEAHQHSNFLHWYVTLPYIEHAAANSDPTFWYQATHET